MIVEQRDYLLRPGAAAHYVRLWEEYGREPQVRILGNLLGCWTTEVGDLNTLVYFWGFESLEDRAERRAVLAGDEAFASFRGHVRDLLVRQTNRLLVPAGTRTPAGRS
ncbi:NIPSNAP family protein [Streptomyces scabiei]|uniref:NIPSNAP domain-containing protein n=1 Tax=Streptomyces scabiei TaxID=1930 RepID=A0A100JI34_STRSC|nr:NIPSNAP family protein [Streptomyces scabiei]GAQ59787.1 hypothetical protein SsS58_00125 [Streptomyces scabiei]